MQQVLDLALVVLHDLEKVESSVEAARVYLPGRTKQTQLFEGDPKEVAAKLVEKLKFEARVL